MTTLSQLPRVCLATCILVTISSCEPSPRGVVWKLPSGRELQIVHCAVELDPDENALRWWVSYRTHSHGRPEREAEESLILADLRDRAHAAGVTLVGLWGVYARPHIHWNGWFPHAVSEESTGRTFQMCVDGSWQRFRDCTRAPSRPGVAEHLGDGSPADPRKALCGDWLAWYEATVAAESAR